MKYKNIYINSDRCALVNSLSLLTYYLVIVAIIVESFNGRHGIGMY